MTSEVPYNMDGNRGAKSRVLREGGRREEAALCAQPAPEVSWEGQAGTWSCVSGKSGSREKRKRWEEGQREKKAVKGKKKEGEKERE